MTGNEFKSFFKRVAGNEGDRCHYPTRLDTYGCGCQHNCGYCYARSLLDFRKLWNPAQPSIANINKIRHTIRTKLKPGEIVRLGGMTDCFQPLERENGITLQTIKALNEMGVGYLIVTKSSLVAEPEYIAAMDKNLAHIQISITITDEALCNRVEPGASDSPEMRMRAAEALQEQGFDVAVRLSPFVPEFVDLDVINSIRCDKIIVEFLRVNSWIRKWLTNLDAGVDLSVYSEHHAGYDHMPLYGKIRLLKGIHFKEVSVCEDVPGHQLYWETHVNANPEDCCNLRTR